MIFTFPYQEQRGVEPSPAVPDRAIYRPKIPLRITGPRDDHAVAVALVDTGADETILPLALARPLRVRLGSRLHSLRDAGGHAIYVRYGMVRMTIAQSGVGEYSWKAVVGFQKNRPYSVLGFAGCLDRLDVRFDGPNRRVLITTPD